MGCSEKDRCTIEEITLDHGTRQYVLIPEIIFQTDDIILVATGAFSCVRALYRTAARSRALERFYYEVITTEQYAGGQAEDIIAKLLERALEMTDAGGIIYYASCMDVVTKIDFDRIRSRIHNPGNVPVEVLYRGPMVRRFLDSNKKLTELLMKIPPVMKFLKKDEILLPPVMPDFEAICGVLQSFDVYRFLLSPGGCDGCLSGTGEKDECYEVTKSRVNDIDISLGCEDKMKSGIIWDYRRKKLNKTACITSAGLLKLIGFDYEKVFRELQEEQVPVLFVPSDGFHFASEGIADLYIALLQNLQSKNEKNCPDEIVVWGANCYSTVTVSDLREGTEQLKSNGYKLLIPEREGLSGFDRISGARCSWVVSTEGIRAAKWMKEKYQIPYVIGLPSNRKMLGIWKEFISNRDAEVLSGLGRSESKIKIDSRPFSKGVILLIGDPVVIYSIGIYLAYISNARPIYAVYAQIPSVKRWYKATFRNTEKHWIGNQFQSDSIRFFKDKEELLPLVEEADIIFGDILMKQSFTEKELYHKKWVDLPMPVIHTGIRREQTDYALFGSKGLRWINRNIDVH